MYTICKVILVSSLLNPRGGAQLLDDSVNTSACRVQYSKVTSQSQPVSSGVGRGSGPLHSSHDQT